MLLLSHEIQRVQTGLRTWPTNCLPPALASTTSVPAFWILTVRAARSSSVNSQLGSTWERRGRIVTPENSECTELLTTWFCGTSPDITYHLTTTNMLHEPQHFLHLQLSDYADISYESSANETDHVSHLTVTTEWTLQWKKQKEQKMPPRTAAEPPVPAWPPMTGHCVWVTGVPFSSEMNVLARTMSKVVTPNSLRGSNTPFFL